MSLLLLLFLLSLISFNCLDVSSVVVFGLLHIKTSPEPFSSCQAGIKMKKVCGPILNQVGLKAIPGEEF